MDATVGMAEGEVEVEIEIAIGATEVIEMAIGIEREVTAIVIETATEIVTEGRGIEEAEIVTEGRGIEEAEMTIRIETQLDLAMPILQVYRRL
jgi:hypothetical protein